MRGVRPKGTGMKDKPQVIPIYNLEKFVDMVKAYMDLEK